MKATELLSELRTLGPQDANVVFQFLADRLYQSRDRMGRKLFSVGDVKSFLEELADAAKLPDWSEHMLDSNPSDSGPFVMRSSGPALRCTNLCSDCEHEHTMKDRCAYYLGEGKFCECTSKAVAA